MTSVAPTDPNVPQNSTRSYPAFHSKFGRNSTTYLLLLSPSSSLRRPSASAKNGCVHFTLTKAGRPCRLSDDIPPETQQPSHELLRPREGDQVPSRDHLYLRVQPLTSDALLELEREESVVRCRDDPHRNLRPALEAARLTEDRIGLLSLTRRTAAQYRLRDIVQEIGGKVELRGISAGRRRGDSRVHGARIAPPSPGGLPRLSDHGIDEHQPVHGLRGAGEGCRETTERLRDEDDIRSRSDRLRDYVRVVPETLARIVRRQVDRDRLAASLLEERHDPVPVPSHPAGARDEDERRH